ncbi:Glutamate-cysteine ligase modifier subunit [Scedosporium apiospermum]|uniref:GCS light chain n=1 Tax=Pseudallescheria apiosperma TaxID=563466 RepID=A0A084FU87_PSEDA|nr:Glutamate-cysteine ligase modifier subunit [Scedosporium apiospermum]KEZ38649.1 Glutamate-cysteine ligase modifier subunit [Scedosporium apiospermum]
MTKLILSTGNIVSGGPSIIRKPGTFRSNLELTNSLRSNFLAAQQDYAEAPDRRNGNTNGANGASNDAHSSPARRRPAVEAWTERDGPVLYVPRISWSVAGLHEERSQYDITLKLFFLPDAPVHERAQYVTEALSLVHKELGITTIDLLIASFPGMSFEGDCEWEADKKNATQGNLDEEVATWAILEELYREGIIRGLGIAEFGSEKLTNFLKRVSVRPVVDQINIRDCCKVPPLLTKLAMEENIELYVHTDCTNILPSGTLRELLGRGPQGASVLADVDEGIAGLQGDIIPQWVVKYTAFVKNRGVIENKGYFAGAEIIDG